MSDGLGGFGRTPGELAARDENLAAPFEPTPAMRARSNRATVKGMQLLEQWANRVATMTDEERLAWESKVAEHKRQFDQRLQEIRHPSPEVRFLGIVGDHYAACRLSTFRIGDDWTEAEKQQAMKILGRLQGVADHIEEAVKVGRRLVLHGEPGVGKDHLACGVMWAAVVKGMTCKIVNGSDFAESVMTQADFGFRVSDRDWAERYVNPDVLVLSDPDGKRTNGPNDAVREKLYLVADQRYRRGKPTWVTINGSSPDKFIQRVGAAAWSRFEHEAWVLHCNWPSSRTPRGVIE
jgi:DNA replication protein DnaC